MDNNARLTLDSPLLRSRLRTERLAPQSSYRRGAEVTRQQAKIERYRRARANPYQTVVIEKSVEVQPEKIYGLAASLDQIDHDDAGRRRQFKVSRLQAKAMTAMAVVLFLFGAGAAISSIITNRSVAQAASSLSGGGDSSNNSVLADGDKPDESQPSDAAIMAHAVAPDLPKLITIPGIQAKARVIKLATDKTGKLNAPKNIFDTGWYGESAKPGENGAMLIDGHSTGITKVGIFSRLKELKSGDIISVTRGDDKVFNYKVVNSKVFSDTAVDMNSAMVSADTSKAGLNLISCSGKAKANGDYDQRIIVYAVAN